MNIKYKVIKLILKEKVLDLFKGKETYLHITEEYELRKDFIISLYVEDLKNRIVYAYLIIDKDIDKNREFEEENKQLIEYGFIKESKLIVIPLRTLSNDIIKLSEELDKFIF
jgi:hypothetical protein